MVWHSGLRGAMAFALAEMLDPATISNRSMLVATTLGIVLITTTVVGTSTPLVLRLLHIKVGDIESETEVLAAARRAAPPPPKSLLARWTRLDRRYIMPFLTNRYKTTGPKRSTDALSVMTSQPSAGYGLARAASANTSTAIEVDRRQSAPQNPIDVDDDYLEGYDDRWLTTTTTDAAAGGDLEHGGGPHDGHALLTRSDTGAGLDDHGEQHEDHDLDEHDDNDGPLMRAIGTGAGAGAGAGAGGRGSGSGSGSGSAFGVGVVPVTGRPSRESVASGPSRESVASGPSRASEPSRASGPVREGPNASTTPATFATSSSPLPPSSLPQIVQPLQSATSDSLYAHF